MGLAVAGGCSKRDPSDLFAPEAGTLVVDGFLVVGHPMGDIVVSETVAANDTYVPEQAAVSGASVRILRANGVVTFYESITRPGTYTTQGVSYFVQPGAVYTLDVTTADGRHVTATTRTPQPLDVRDWVLLDDTGTTIDRRLASFADYGNGVFLQPENQLIYSQGLLEGQFEPDGILGIQVGLFSRTPNSPFVIDPDFLSDEDLAKLPRISNSPPIDPGDGTVRLPWFAIFFEGQYVFKLWSMDQNWFDLARTDPVLQGGSFGLGGQAGDNFERPIFHVEGGIGLFGSGAVDSVGVVIHPRP